MGWTYPHFDEPNKLDYFIKNFSKVATPESPISVTHIRSAFVGRKVLYGVWEHKTPEQTYRFGTVILLDYGSENGQRYWGYKDMDESCGPIEREMPKSLMKELLKAQSPRAAAGGKPDYGSNWRKECMRNILHLTPMSLYRRCKRGNVGNAVYQKLNYRLKQYENKQITAKEYLASLKEVFGEKA